MLNMERKPGVPRTPSEDLADLLARSPRTKRSDAIVEDIKRWIALSGMKPGDRLPQEKELISLFSSSRGTVREALKSLEVQGLVEISSGPNGGARLKRVPEDRAMQLLSNYFYFQDLHAKDIYVLRRAVEPLIAREVVGHLTAGDFAQLERSVEICRRGHRGEVDPATHRIAELQFHQILANRVPNRLLRFYGLFLNYILYNFVTPKAVAQGQHTEFSCHVIDAHEALLKALQKSNGRRAEKLMLQHMEQAAALVSDIEMAFDRRLLATPPVRAIRGSW